MPRKKKTSAEAAVRDIRRMTRRRFSAEEKIRIVLEGIAAANRCYRWSKDFLEAGKKRLAGDTVREATTTEVKDLRAENRQLEEVVVGDGVAHASRALGAGGQPPEEDRGRSSPNLSPDGSTCRHESLSAQLPPAAQPGKNLRIWLRQRNRDIVVL